jgi:hypothetical protein
MADMRLAERHARLRAHDDPETISSAYRWVVEHFGGDHIRAAWFFDELVAKTRVSGTKDTFFSVKTKTRRSIHIRSEK